MTTKRGELNVKKLLAAIIAGVFTLTAATAVIAADKKDEKSTEKKADKKK